MYCIQNQGSAMTSASDILTGFFSQTPNEYSANSAYKTTNSSLWNNPLNNVSDPSHYVAAASEISNKSTLGNALYAINNNEKSSDFKVLQETGLQTYRIKEGIADLAQTNFKDYIEYKRLWQEKMKAEVLRTYAVTYEMYQSIGYTPRDCEDRAKRAAAVTQEMQYEVFNSVFKRQGEPVHDEY